MAPAFRKTIAVFEIVGGVSGPCFVAYELFTNPVTAQGLVGVVIVTAIFIFALFAGVAFWKDRRSGYICSAVVQLIQLPKILSATLAFKMSFGFDFSVMLISVPERNSFGVGFNFGLLSDYLLRVGDSSLPYGLGVSLVSCIFLLAFVDALFRRKIPVHA